MLRSIVAVWCLALALLVIAATAGCIGGGCANGDDCSVGTYQYPDMAKPAPVCATTCGTCAANEFCYQPSTVAQLPAFCARQCADDRDCQAGEKCAQLFAALQPPVCITDTSPVGCAAPTPGWHCDFPAPSCFDAHTTEIPFSDASRMICGSELVHCANGCVTGACQ